MTHFAKLVIMPELNKVVLAYSGGLDTSAIFKWLQEHYGSEVITYTADLGQGEEVETARAKAAALGAGDIRIEDLREEFVRDYVFPMFRANAVYEGEYLLGTAIARPLIAKRLAEVAMDVGADAVAHGATGKGNDQVRFELGIHALAPQLQVVAPWREWELRSREQVLAYCERYGIPVEHKREGGSPYSMDANLLHISYEGGPLEDPWQAPPQDMWRWTMEPSQAPAEGAVVEISFQGGDPVALDGQVLSPALLLERLNQLGGQHGIGRADIVENRFVGMKSRGCYETPGGTILQKAHRAMESLTLDREAAHLKDELMPRYAALIYNGYWWSPERRMLQAAIDESQGPVNGQVRLSLCRGQVAVTGRSSEDSLFDEGAATFEDDAGSYRPADAEGFIRMNALRLWLAALRGRKG